MNGRLFAEVFVTLTVIMDPPGAVPVFLAVTRDLTAKLAKSRPPFSRSAPHSRHPAAGLWPGLFGSERKAGC